MRQRRQAATKKTVLRRLADAPRRGFSALPGFSAGAGFSAYEGTSQIQRMIITREILREGA